MADTHFPGGSTKTLPGTVGRHDGHHDGHLNCVALRHGWTRTFSISPDELAVIDYDTLERILEINTLRIRPMGLRVFIEQPADSATWSKVRSWKHDNSLQSILVQKYLEERRAAGIITRFDVRDGSDRRDESDKPLPPLCRQPNSPHHASRRALGCEHNNRTPEQLVWYSYPSAFGQGKEEAAGEPPAKQSGSIFGYLNPLALFSSSAAPAAEPDAQNLISPEEARAAEVEQLRKRGWMPPGLARRQKSLRDRLRATEGHNPFLGGSRVYNTRGKKKSSESEDPFADQDASEITPQEVDEFFEIDRTSSILELNNRPVCFSFEPKRRGSRLKGGKNKKNKGKQKGELGGGADIVSHPEDAFPNSPHHSRNNVDKIDGDDD
ncbi:hypothetical protein C8F04DRAFT_1335667 [Mycena alexandri]|uniref:Uncharacterized protein n=1 Tax=Mycena alexandri TaxID=1745969 RepID=A0AAD6WM14_9AGAR|nr:hypothetical protein C8F04DRAFT_1335667 [Mycena alexandri]